MFQTSTVFATVTASAHASTTVKVDIRDFYMKKMLEFYTNINSGLIPEPGIQPPLSCAGRTGLIFSLNVLNCLCVYVILIEA